jgi:hypothetical protein
MKAQVLPKSLEFNTDERRVNIEKLGANKQRFNPKVDAELKKLKQYFQNENLLSSRTNEIFPSSVPLGFVSTLSDNALKNPRNTRLRNLELELNQLKTKYVEAVNAKSSNEKQLSQIKANIVKMQGLSHILNKVEPKAQDCLLDSETFASFFSNDRTCAAFVMSVDLRKSTTLMLKARDSQRFAVFITHLCNRLYNTILKYHGVFDKFTGDGILAFFPDFYSGIDAGFYALKAASECHEIFHDEYKKHRNGFISVLSDVGLGIGIDFGSVTLVSLWGGLTVVGAPVVYACRMGAAPAGSTLLNQPAFEVVFSKYSDICTFFETSIDIKGEGQTIAYDVKLNGKNYEHKLPNWCAETKKTTAKRIQART